MSLTNTCKIDICQFNEFEELVTFILSVPETEKEWAYKVDLQKVVTFLMQAIAKHPAPIIRNDEGKIVGCMVLAEEEPLWWSKETFLFNPILYIKPEYRSIKLVNKLLEWGQTYGEMEGIPFAPGLVCVSDFDKKTKLLERKGYKPFGILYKK